MSYPYDQGGHEQPRPPEPQDPHSQPYGEQQYGGQQYGAQSYGSQQYGGVDPYGMPYPGGPYGQYDYGGYGAIQQRGTNGMAIAALVSAIGGALLCGVLSIVGAILGHLALNQIKQTGEEGRGMALAGVIIGWVAFGLSVLVIVLLVVIGVNAENLP